MTPETAAKNAAISTNALEKKNYKTELYAMQGGSKQTGQHQRGGSRERKAHNAGGRFGRNQQQQQLQLVGDTPKASAPKCYCCDRLGHTNRECRFREYECHKCNEKGHLAIVCRSEGGKEREPVSNSTASVKMITAADEQIQESHEKDFFKIDQI